METFSSYSLKIIYIIIIWVTTLPIILYNEYVAFQVWMESAISYKITPFFLKKFYHQIILDIRHILLAFASNFIFFFSFMSSIFAWINFWNLIPWLFIPSTFIGINGAIGRKRSLKYQKLKEK